jgi:hypothetical protein
MRDSDTVTLSLFSPLADPAKQLPMRIARGLGVPTRALIRNIGNSTALLSFSSAALPAGAGNTGLAGGPDQYQLPAGAADVFILAPDQEIFAISLLANNTQVSVTVSEVVVGGESGTIGGTIVTTGNRQAFIYTATGLEGNSFDITLPAVRADTNYIAQVSGGGLAALKTFDTPRSLYTTTKFHVISSSPMALNDVLNIVVQERTS